MYILCTSTKLSSNNDLARGGAQADRLVDRLPEELERARLQPRLQVPGGVVGRRCFAGGYGCKMKSPSRRVFWEKKHVFLKVSSKKMVGGVITNISTRYF